MTTGQRIVHTVLQARWVLLFAVLLLTGIAGLGASRVGVDNAVDIWFVDDDPALVAYRDFLETFGNDEVVVTAVFDETSGMYTEQGLQQVHAVAEAARATDGIGTARSMVDVTGVRGGPGTLDIGPAIEDWPIDAQDAAEAKTAIETDPLLSRLTDPDGQTGLVLAEMAAMGDIDQRRDAAAVNERAERLG